MILTRKSHNCDGTAFVQGDSAGGSKLIEQTLHVQLDGDKPFFVHFIALSWNYLSHFDLKLNFVVPALPNNYFTLQAIQSSGILKPFSKFTNRGYDKLL